MQRGALAIVALVVTAGCLGASETPVESATSEDAGPTTPAPPFVERNASASPKTPRNVTAVPVASGPDPCTLPLDGLTDPCLADGFHFGEAAFWEGGALPGVAETGTSATCARTGCADTSFVVAQTAEGARLRVDVQIYFTDPSHIRTLADTLTGHETGLDLALYPPGVARAPGNEAAATDTWGTFAATMSVGGYDVDTREARPGPATGEWTLRVYGTLPDAFQYRLRAKLEAPAPPGDALAYPDLRIIPPFEVGFMAPTATFQPGVPTPIAVPGAGCMAEEYVEAHRNGLARPTLCLRFSMGFANGGDGNWRLKMPDVASGLPTEDGPEIPVTQSVCTADGRLCRDLPRPEGLVARWDAAHEHYHYQNAYVFDLYRVGPGGLERVSTSGKLGIDPGPESFVGWTTFGQLDPWGPIGRDASGAEDPADKELNAGWGDVYDWNRAGNYVPFPADATQRPVPGEYVLRGATDPLRQIAETDETNNEGYTWFRVDAMGRVEILERGMGRDPWDAEKAAYDVTP